VVPSTPAAPQAERPLLAAGVGVLIGMAILCAIFLQASPEESRPAEPIAVALLPEKGPPDMPLTPGPEPDPVVNVPRKHPVSDPPASLPNLPPTPEVKPDPRPEAPQPMPEAPPRAPGARPFKRLSDAVEEDLRQQLAVAPEIGIGSAGRAILANYASHFRKNLAVTGDAQATLALPLLEVVPDAGGLPLRMGSACELSSHQAATLDALSRKLRVYTNVLLAPDAEGKRPEPTAFREKLTKEMRGKRPEWVRAEAIPTLMQMLMHEERPIRQILIDVLAEIPGRQSTIALAQRAVFDLDREVRASAVAVLKGRAAEDFRPVLLKALRYPWAPAAEHAAEALVGLDDRQAVPQLVVMLKQPDPAGPQSLKKDHAILQEVVRTHHLTNCILCHPPSQNGSEPVLGQDPVLTLTASTPGQASAARRLQGTPGSHSYGQGSRGGGSNQVPALIRGDVTYLRQDFSVLLPLPPRGPGPLAAPTQRFDYIVRTRVVPPKELVLLKTNADPTAYPQRESVLFALRELTGKDVGTTTIAWQELFPRAETEAEGVRLCSTLLQATPLRREILLNHLREGASPACTIALAEAIPSLKGDWKDKARDVLIERLGRLPAGELREKLRDQDPEIRQAAVLACTQKQKKELLPELIALLPDQEPRVAHLAEEGLRYLTGEKFDTPDAWQFWWNKRSDP
jgi:hypothetical protein